MSMETDFRALLVGDPAILALVSTRIYPKTYAQATVDPAVRYSKVSDVTGVHMQGSDGLSSAIMQVDARALTELEVLNIRDALVARLHAFQGIEGKTDFRLIAINSDRGGDFDATGTKSYYTTSIDFAVSYRAA